MFKKRGLVIVFLLITCLTVSAQAATLNGTIYEWSDFEKPLKNTIVELDLNSTKIQYKVSTDGTYAFEHISPGNYTIKAKYYRNNILEYTGEEFILIDKTDDAKNIDILLFPPTESEYEYLGDINLTSSMDIKDESNINYYIIILLILVLCALMLIYWIKKKKGIAIEHIKDKTLELPPENIAETAHRELPEDLRNLYDTILKMGGRTTQKDLRKKMAYSEAKVSLMLDDLEDRGLIKKIKKGRSNIIIAEVQQ